MGPLPGCRPPELFSLLLCGLSVFQNARLGQDHQHIIRHVLAWPSAEPRHYIASKGGIIGFTRALGGDLGEFNIRVNAITPGGVETEKEKQRATPEILAAFVAMQARRRRVLPKDIARAAVFLSSADSDIITGQTLKVDGGLAMH
jgi:NAD(P)-dependent dehydrogenase (short-subunit alcohol dehydrogenase family)